MVVIDAADGVDPLLRAAVEAWRAAAQASPAAFYRSLIPWTYSAEYIERSHQFFADREKAIAGFPKPYFDCFVSLCDAFLDLDVASELHRITCPTLVLEGGKDILTPGCGRRIAAAIPGAWFASIPGAGHAGVVEAPGPIIAEIRRFWTDEGFIPAGTGGTKE
jgi:pimeloyl-ACP methyl ester carboxylesterase